MTTAVTSVARRRLITPLANAWNTIDLSSANCGTLAPNTRYWITFDTDTDTLQRLTSQAAPAPARRTRHVRIV